MAIGRRQAPPVPGGDTPKPAVMWLHIIRLWRYVGAAYSGHPAPHETTHLAGATDALQTPGAPTTIVPDDSATVGLGPSYAYEDHGHAIAAGTPVAIGTANAEGTSSSFARADHVHDASAIQNETFFYASFVSGI